MKWCFSRVAAALCLLLTALACRTPAGAQTPPYTQRRINEIAATLEITRRALIEDTGMRDPKEPLQPYMARITAPLPNETTLQYKTRVQGYLNSLSQLTHATAFLRAMPPLSDVSAGNQRAWREGIRLLTTLPGEVAKTRAAFHRALANRGETAQFTSVYGRTLYSVVDAWNDFRDAKP